MFFNDFKQNNNYYFSNDIDNVESVEKINNMLVGALQRSNGTSNGIVHLYNLTNPIQAKDKKRFDAISRFFGQCIQNVEDLTKKLTQTLAVTQESGPAVLAVSNSVEILTDKKDNYLQLLKPINNYDMQINQSLIMQEKIDQDINQYNLSIKENAYVKPKELLDIKYIRGDGEGMDEEFSKWVKRT